MKTKHLEVLCAIKRQGGTFWTRIGTAFPTKDESGYRLSLDYFPAALDSDIVMLPPKTEAEEKQT